MVNEKYKGIIIILLLLLFLFGCTDTAKVNSERLEQIDFNFPVALYDGSGCIRFLTDYYPTDWTNEEPSTEWIATQGCTIGFGSPHYYRHFSYRSPCSPFKYTEGGNIYLRTCATTATKQIISEDGTIGPLEKVGIVYMFDTRNLKNSFYHIPIVPVFNDPFQRPHYVNTDINMILLPSDINIISINYIKGGN